MEDEASSAQTIRPDLHQPTQRNGIEERLAIGFLTGNIHVGASHQIWSGVVDAAERCDVNLFCFPGGGLGAPAEFESQRNLNYDLVKLAGLSVLVSRSSTITEWLDPGDVAAFYQRYRDLPMVTLTQPVAGIPGLSVDSYQGMRTLISHLIEVHGFRRLAFIRGPAEHYYAQERYRAYRDGLDTYGIAFDPRLVTPHYDWQLESGAAAVQLLLDTLGLRPGADVEALIAVSDLLALGALQALQARSVRVPHELALVGFNDFRDARLANPPLTTVAMPFYEQGWSGIETALAFCAGAQVPDQVMLQTRLVVRQSCGCPSRAMWRPPMAASSAAAAPPQSDTVLAEMAQLWSAAGGSPAELAHIFDAFHTDLREWPSGRFLAALERALEQGVTRDDDLPAWQDSLSALRHMVLPCLERQAREQAEELFGQARMLIGEVAQRAQGYRQLQADRQGAILREIGQALITTVDTATLTDVLAEHLPRIGIASCYLGLYEQPEAPLEALRLILAYTERGRVALEPGGRRLATYELVPPELLPQRRRFSMVVEPLYFRETQIGFALFEIGPRDPSVYEVLRGHISSALKGAQLMSEVRQAQLAAEKANQIKTRLLANVSHELRTPLHIILDRSRDVLEAATAHGDALRQELLNDLLHIQQSAEHQLRLINDLLDLSRAEIDALDLYLEPLDPRPLLEETFRSMARPLAEAQPVAWRLELPDQLPWLYADPVRLRQILLNLLSNAQKFTRSGHITLGAAAMPSQLHIWLEDTGIGIPRDQQERIFEPFVTAEHSREAQQSGIGLGLAISRRLIALHGGRLTVEARPAAGSVFHIFLPLLSADAQPPPERDQPVLLVISNSIAPADEIVAWSQRQGLALRQLRPGDDLEGVLASVRPVALAWDLFGSSPEDWTLVRRLQQRQGSDQLPFLVYGHGQADEQELAVGLTSFVAKPASSQTLLETIGAAHAIHPAGPILVVDDDPAIRKFYCNVVAQGLPGHPIRAAGDGAAALALMAGEVPSLVLLDLIMPELDGSDLLDLMRADPRLRQVPVVILSNKLLTLDDIKRLEQHAHVTLQSKGILSEEETVALLQRVLAGTDALTTQTSALVKRAVAYLHQNYARPISRWELAQDVGASEDYISRLFNRELGLSPWDYLNRYRIYQAKDLLRRTNHSITSIAHQVGFHDQRYFSRVFRNLTGEGPKEFRKRPAPLE